ncbi:MAG: GAP family protein [Actinobacteria bacterium]|nr:GAP family protein [Actinomycetota bacterium]
MIIAGLDGGLLGEMVALGLGAFDPVGLAAMPILLSQAQGVRRAWTFILGSVTAIMILGIAFASGLGRPIVSFSKQYPWLNSAIELTASVILVGIAVWLLWHARSVARSGKNESLASESFTKRLELPLALLFVFGFLLVTVQSLVDVVFLVAMVEMGTRELPLVGTAVAVATYTLAALALQMIVVVVYQLLSTDRRDAALARFNAYLDSHGELVAGVLTLVLGLVLAGISVHELLKNV